MSITKAMLLLLAGLQYGCASLKCGASGCMRIDSPHFGGGYDPYPIDSLLKAGLDTGTGKCPEFPKAICRYAADSLFGMGSMVDYRDESNIRRIDTVWVFLSKSREAGNKAIVYHSGTMPGEWEVDGKWTILKEGTCKFEGRDPEISSPTIISAPCRILPSWIQEGK